MFGIDRIVLMNSAAARMRTAAAVERLESVKHLILIVNNAVNEAADAGETSIANVFDVDQSITVGHARKLRKMLADAGYKVSRPVRNRPLSEFTISWAE